LCITDVHFKIAVSLDLTSGQYEKDDNTIRVYDRLSTSPVDVSVTQIIHFCL